MLRISFHPVQRCLRAHVLVLVARWRTRFDFIRFYSIPGGSSVWRSHLSCFYGVQNVNVFRPSIPDSQPYATCFSFHHVSGHIEKSVKRCVRGGGGEVRASMCSVAIAMHTRSAYLAQDICRCVVLWLYVLFMLFAVGGFHFIRCQCCTPLLEPSFLRGFQPLSLTLLP